MGCGKLTASPNGLFPNVHAILFLMLKLQSFIKRKGQGIYLQWCFLFIEDLKASSASKMQGIIFVDCYWMKVRQLASALCNISVLLSLNTVGVWVGVLKLAVRCWPSILLYAFFLSHMCLLSFSLCSAQDCKMDCDTIMRELETDGNMSKEIFHNFFLTFCTCLLFF